jgi:MinD-like ATPase involved in chromosome partitioning or flagellar assembly
VTLPVATCGLATEWEAGLVGAFRTGEQGVQVVRRCVELAELLAVAASGLARAALVSSELRGLDRDTLTRCAVAGVAVVAVSSGSPDELRRMQTLGVRQVITAGASPAEVAAALLRAASAAPQLAPYDVADPLSALPTPSRPGDQVTADVTGEGRVVAVWGPTGAPGRTSVAVGVAAELAELGVTTLLVDADPYGGVVAQMLGLLDESPGIAAACRLANNGALDADALRGLALQVRPRLSVLTGIARADRWPELRASGVDDVLRLAQRLVDVVVVDCGFCLERDEELSFDTAAPRRNGATLTALAVADTVLAVAAADPIGLQRFVRGVGELLEVVPTASPVTVVNRVRAAAVGGGDPEREIAAALDQFAGLSGVRFVPLDTASYDVALASGRLLIETAPQSPARLALQSIATGIAGTSTVPRRGRSRLALRRRSAAPPVAT